MVTAPASDETSFRYPGCIVLALIAAVLVMVRGRS
jgi:hypothetical protein